MRQQKRTIALAIIFSLCLFLSSSAADLKFNDYDSAEIEDFFDLSESASPDVFYFGDSLTTSPASTLLSTSDSFASLTEQQSTEENIMDEAYEFDPNFKMADYEFSTILAWENNPGFERHLSMDSGLPYEDFGSNRLEFDHNWPQISHQPVKLSALSLFFHRKLSHLILIDQDLKQIELILKNGLIDWTRPVVKTTGEKRSYHTFLSLSLLPSNYNSEVFFLILQFFPKDLIDSHAGDGNTALVHAIYKGRVDAVKCLLVAGANANIVLKGGRMLPSLAVACGRPKMISVLALSGRCTVLDKNLLSVMFKYNRPEGIVFLLTTGQASDASISKLLLSLLAKKRDFGLGCLRHAVRYLSWALLNELLIHFVEIGELEAVQVIFEMASGLQIGLQNLKALDVAIDKGNESVIRLLLPRLQPSALCWAIQKALSEQKYPLASFLAASVPLLNDLVMENGLSLPSFVAMYGKPDDLRALLQNQNCDPFRVDASGKCLVTMDGIPDDNSAIIFAYIFSL